MLCLTQPPLVVWYFGAFVAFALSQLDTFLLSKVIAREASASVDGSFIATLLQTISVGLLFGGWRSITEGSSCRGSCISTWLLMFVLQRTGRMTCSTETELLCRLACYRHLLLYWLHSSMTVLLLQAYSCPSRTDHLLYPRLPCFDECLHSCPPDSAWCSSIRSW